MGRKSYLGGTSYFSRLSYFSRRLTFGRCLTFVGVLLYQDVLLFRASYFGSESYPRKSSHAGRPFQYFRAGGKGLPAYCGVTSWCAMANSASSSLVETPVLSKMFDKCRFTVSSLRPNCLAMSRLLQPSTIEPTTSNSRGVRPNVLRWGTAACCIRS